MKQSQVSDRKRRWAIRVTSSKDEIVVANCKDESAACRNKEPDSQEPDVVKIALKKLTMFYKYKYFKTQGYLRIGKEV